MNASPCAIVLTGPAGAGKSALGVALSQQTGWRFIEADEYHPPANIQKMRQGIPLNDADRQPWLDALASLMQVSLAQSQSVVVTCSALKRRYRQTLRAGDDRVKIVSLKVSRDVLAARLSSRAGHFFPPELLESQLQSLEPATDADLRLDATQPVETLVEAVMQFIRLDQVK